MPEPTLGTLSITNAVTGAATITYGSDSTTAAGSIVVQPGGQLVFVPTASGDKTELDNRSDTIARQNEAD